MRNLETVQRARLTVGLLFVAVAMFAGGSVAWHSGERWLAVAFAVGFFVCLSIPNLTFDPDDEDAEDPRWGANGERWSMSDDEFENLVRAVEDTEASARATPTLAASVPAELGFAGLVRDAIEALPDFVKAELGRNLAILVADDGTKPERYGSSPGEAYGLYLGSTVAYPNESARVVLFRDTLTRDFADPDDLKEQVTITLRHELAHHFGADERRVAELGL